MLNVEKAIDLKTHVGGSIGMSDWLTIEQAAIDDFARLTGDDHWIHVDVERAKKEMPGGRTIAHGLYILSLIPVLQRQVYRIERRGRGLNYGYERVRFTSPVPVRSRVRLNLNLVSVEPQGAFTRIETDAVMELENSEKPAAVARNIVLIADA
ncbi:MaoC family dehydratase [Rhizobium terrae]|uniref:MaoC family dehydratase n=1 Tax=Rhizobium terrae TaxID=2171756 RepID=UPI000E3BD8EE|nr:MaoC family dehydratase [Rhizobium terrae]